MKIYWVIAVDQALYDVCGTKAGPKGTAGLKVRSWNCMTCQTSHDRDINASLNIAKKFIEDNKLVIVANDNYSDSKNKSLQKTYSVSDVRLFTEQSL